jgi:hypothetical protein
LKKRKNRSKRSRQKSTTDTQKTEKPKSLPDSPQRQSWLQLIRTHPYWTAVSGFLTFAGLLFGIVSGLPAIFGGPPWPTAPVFSPGSPSFGAALDVPFKVDNRSVVFWITGLRIRCKVEGKVPDQPGMTNTTFGPNFVGANGTNAIAPNSSAPFTCPMRHSFVIGRDVTDIIRHSRVTFISEYDGHLSFGRASFEDGPFTWNTDTVPPHWERGLPLK